jgi:hypothetical protein
MIATSINFTVNVSDLAESGSGREGKAAYLQILKEYRVPRPVDLREQILIQHFAHQLEKIDFTLIVRLTLQQREQ